MNPQTVQETHRILAVVEDLIEDLSILGRLPPYFSALPKDDMKRIVNAFSNQEAAMEVQSQLAEHYKAEMQLESASVGVTKDDIEDHRLGTRALVDTLRQAGYPTVETEYQPSDSLGNFTEIITVLRNLLRDRLTTTVEDDVVKFVILNDTVNREKTASADVQALNREYQNEKESRRVEVEKRRVTIQKLRDEIERVRSSSRTDMENFSKVAKEMSDAAEIKFAQRQADLTTEAEKAANDARVVEERNAEAEAQLRQQRSKKEKELAERLHHYDIEMNNLTKAVESLTSEIETDAKALQEVDGKLRVLNAEAALYELERRNGELREQHNADLEAKMQYSAKLIQGFIRAFAVRQAAAAGKKKKKGKKK